MNALKHLKSAQSVFVIAPLVMASALTSCQNTSAQSSSVMLETLTEALEKNRVMRCAMFEPVPLPDYIWNALPEATADALEAQGEDYFCECIDPANPVCR